MTKVVNTAKRQAYKLKEYLEVYDPFIQQDNIMKLDRAVDGLIVIERKIRNRRYLTRKSWYRDTKVMSGAACASATGISQVPWVAGNRSEFRKPGISFWYRRRDCCRAYKEGPDCHFGAGAKCRYVAG